MSRVQLALNVVDLEASIGFYTELFGEPPHKRRPGYANFAISDPPLKLVLIEADPAVRGHGVAGALNHLGVEVETTQQVRQAAARLRASDLAVVDELGTTCCYAQQDKAWVHDPAGAPWEVYTITDDDPAPQQVTDGACCTGTSVGRPDPAGREELPLTTACC